MTFKSILFILCTWVNLPVFGNNHFFFVDDYRQHPVDSVLKNEIPADSLFQALDSIPEAPDSLQQMAADSLLQPADSLRFSYSKDTIDAPVVYSADDSIIYDIENKIVHLYGNAKAHYKNVDLTSDYIEYNWANNTLTALVNYDEQGNAIKKAVFNEGENKYEAEKIIYNFKTEKGKVYQVITQEGEGFLHGAAVKRNEYNEWSGYKSRYTTCDLEHPHFYFQAKKSKLVPDKVIATGPVNLVVEDVPTPLYLPFGLFPISKGQRNGILMPEYGEETNRGFFLKNGGYYFGISDKMDMEVRGDIYSKGSWAVRTISRYAKRYKFSGNFNLEYGRNRVGEPESPNFQVTNDFRVYWNHTQDSKARPNSNFSANVNFGSTTYDKNFSQDVEKIIRSQMASKIYYSKSWAGKPFNFSAQLSHDQNLNTGQINLTLPYIAFGVSRIHPFKPKKISLKNKWYESIYVGYTFLAQNQISGVDSTFLKPETFKNARYGIKHNVPIGASFKLFKHFQLVPGMNYNEYWYLNTIEKKWDTNPYHVYQGDSIIDTITGRLVTDTLFGFKSARDFNFNLSLNTTLYGQFNFRSKKIKAIRHVFTPSLSFGYIPDFTTPFWKYYKTVQSDSLGHTQTYSIFTGGVNAGPPGGGLQGNIGLRLHNVLEMKVFSKKDTVKNERKLSLLDPLDLSMNYNLAGDSLNLSPLNITAGTRLFQDQIDVRFNAILDPYAYSQQNVRINKFVWETDRRFFKLRSASLSLTARFQGKKKETPVTTEGTELERTDVMSHLNEYYDFNIPWSFYLTYSIGISRGTYGNPDTIRFSHNSLSLNFDISLTPKWKIAITTGYDFARLDFSNTSMSVIRDLHCWELRFEWMPYPLESQFYNIQLNVKSSVLQDLKLTKKKNRYDNVF